MGKRTQISIGLIGLGVVGQGVWKHLMRSRASLERRLGARLELRRVAVRDLTKKRQVEIPRPLLTDDPFSVATDPEIDIVCELIGGTDLARQLCLAALRRGKTVVSANKALICQFGHELFRVAQENRGHFFFEASVAGGIPIIKVIREGLVANRFDLIYGILNGTCNYILTRMERENLTFEDTVADARRLGYVEADESLDLDGWDTAHKAVILAFLAHGMWVDLKGLSVEGIRDVTLDDIQWADRLGYKIKLLGIISRDKISDRISVRVHPTLISKRKVLANVDEVYNGVSVSGDVVGTTVHIGRGAGQDATASAVISDITDAVAARSGSARAMQQQQYLAGDSSEHLEGRLRLADLSEIPGQYYLRLQVIDRPGVLAEVAHEMARHGVSIASLNQPKVSGGESAMLILTTHESNEGSIKKTIRDLKRLESVLTAPFLLRIVGFEE